MEILCLFNNEKTLVKVYNISRLDFSTQALCFGCNKVSNANVLFYAYSQKAWCEQGS